MPRTATLEELFFRMTEGDADAAAAAPGSSTSAAPPRTAAPTPTRRPPSRRRSALSAATATPAPRVRAAARAPASARSTAGSCASCAPRSARTSASARRAIVPLIFIIALLTGSGGPDDVPFGRYVRETGLAIPLVGLLFGSVWLFPLITALVAGDIVASEDNHGTLKTILTRSVERWQIFAGKLLAALTTRSSRS